jgi:integrase
VPRDLPSDELIAEWWEKIPNLQWRWVYSVIAALGVRPHEAFFLKPTSDPLIWDVLDGKTGPRQTSALYPEWVEEWNLLNGGAPNLSYPEFQQYGSQTVHQFARYKIPFVPYDLRHAFAVRCIKFDISASIAARMMGHSVAVHTKTYQRWLSAAEQKAVYQKAITQGPKAPSVSKKETTVSS